AVLFDPSALSAAERSELADVMARLRDREIVHAASLPAGGADAVAGLQAQGRIVCVVGDGLGHSAVMHRADVSISLRGPGPIADDEAGIVFLEEGLSKLGDLLDIARGLDRDIRRGRSMVLAPNVACVVGVFTMGLGLMASVVINNLASLLAMG